MEIYINGNLRNDISPMIGGSLSTTEARVTSSALSVEIPISEAPLKEFDYIEIKERGSYIFSGTILSAKQRAIDNIDLVFRVYDLTIASNADFMSTVFADLGFPEGASVTQILLGNHPSDAWYSADFGEFYGLNYRIEAQGISILEVDRSRQRDSCDRADPIDGDKNYMMCLTPYRTSAVHIGGLPIHESFFLRRKAQTTLLRRLSTETVLHTV